MKKITLFLFIYSTFGVMNSQKQSQLKAIEIYKTVADNIYSPELYEKLGDYYYYENQLDDALEWYDKLYESEKGNNSIEFYFRYAQVFRHLGNYSATEKMMRIFTSMSDSIAIKRYNEHFEDYLSKQSERFLIKEEPVTNTQYSEFSPSFYLGNIIFASTRSSNDLQIYDTNEMKQEDLVNSSLEIYQAFVSDSKFKIVKTRRLKGIINSELSQSSPILTKDGYTMYFTRSVCNFDPRLDRDKCVFKIFRAKRFDNKPWGDLEELPFNSDDFSNLHPALSANEKHLYFVSNRDRKNSTDMYVVKILNDGFSKPEKVVGVNTRFKETFPFVSNKNELYFASNGHPGLGGLDLYVAKLKNYNTVESVYNLGSPINSPNDDFSLIIDDGTRRGYFASNRPGGKGQDDIYSFVEVKPIINDCNIEISGTVFDIVTNVPVTGVKVSLIDDKNNLLETVKVNNDGYFKFSSTSCNDAYFIRASKNNYITNEKFVPKTTLIGSTTNVVNIQLERDGISVSRNYFVSGLEYGGTQVMLGDEITGKYSVDNILFETGSFRLTEKSEQKLKEIADKLLSNPIQRIQINSYTDPRGGESYNLNLSSKRSVATFNYLVYLGIKPIRITMKSLGESNPLKDCDDPNIDCGNKDYKNERRSELILHE